MGRCTSKTGRCYIVKMVPSECRWNMVKPTDLAKLLLTSSTATHALKLGLFNLFQMGTGHWWPTWNINKGHTSNTMHQDWCSTNMCENTSYCTNSSPSCRLESLYLGALCTIWYLTVASDELFYVVFWLFEDFYAGDCGLFMWCSSQTWMTYCNMFRV